MAVVMTSPKPICQIESKLGGRHSVYGYIGFASMITVFWCVYENMQQT